MSNRFLERVLHYALLFPAFLPLVYVDGLLYPYLTPKTLLFRGSGVVLCAVFLMHVLRGMPLYLERLRSPWTWVPGALLVWAYITSLFSVNFSHSFWSIFDRGDGLLTLTIVILFFYVFLMVATERLVARLLHVVAVVASIVGLFATLQWIQYASGFNIPLIPEPQGRVGGTLGNAAFLAGYLGITLWLTAARFLEATGRWRTIFAWGAVLQLVAIVGTATRGTMLALVVASGLGVLWCAWKGEGTIRAYARAVALLGLAVAGLFFVFRENLAQVPFEPVRRLASISLTDVTVESRIFLWSNMVGAVAERPVLGVGAEHISQIFNRIYDPGEIVEEWFDRSHNAFLDYAIQYGIPGLLLYGVLIATLFAQAWKLIREGGSSHTFGYAALGLGVVYTVQNLFVFDTGTTLWLLLAVIAMLFANVYAKPSEWRLSYRVPAGAVYAAGAAIVLLIIPVSLKPLYANLLLADGYRYHVYDARRSTASIEKGYALGTYASIEYGYQAYEMYTARQIQMLEGEALVIAYREVREILENNYAQYPYDTRTAIYYAHILDVAPRGITRDEELLRRVVERTIELSPKRIQSRYLLANLSLRKGDAFPVGSAERARHYREALVGLEAYAAMTPHFSEVRYIIASLYLAIGERTTAESWAKEGLALYRGDGEAARRAAKYYLSTENWPEALRFLREVAQEERTDYPLWYDLAKVEFLNGNVTRAKEIVTMLNAQAPGLTDTDQQFLKELQAAQ